MCVELLAVNGVRAAVVALAPFVVAGFSCAACAAIDNALGGPAPMSETYGPDPYAQDHPDVTPAYLRRPDAGRDGG